MKKFSLLLIAFGAVMVFASNKSVPLSIEGIRAEVYGKLSVMADDAVARQGKKELPKDLRITSDIDLASALTLLQQKWGFDVRAELRDAFQREFNKRKLVVQSDGGANPRRITVGLHEHALRQRLDAVLLPPSYHQPETKSVSDGLGYRLEQIPPHHPPVQLKDTRLFPSFVVSLDVVNDRHELYWSRMLRVSPYADNLVGASTKRLLTDRSHYLKMWRIALRVAAEQLADVLAADIDRLPTASPTLKVVTLTGAARNPEGNYFVEVQSLQIVRRQIQQESEPDAFKTNPSAGGSVILELEIAEDGLVAGWKTVTDTGQSEPKAGAAAAMLRHWRFPPAQVESSPVRYRTRVIVDFGPEKS